MATTLDLVKQSAEITALAESLKATGQNENDAYNTAWIIITGKPRPGTEPIAQQPSNNTTLYIIVGVGIAIALVLALKGQHK